jgi:hypothetical protein
MAGWEQAFQLSLIGASFVFAYIASTIHFNEKIDNGLRLFLYLFAMGMLLASIGSNYSLISATDPTLLVNASGDRQPVGFALNGAFIGVLSIISGLFILLIVVAFISIVVYKKKKKQERQYGESNQEE